MIPVQTLFFAKSSQQRAVNFTGFFDTGKHLSQDTQEFALVKSNNTV